MFILHCYIFTYFSSSSWTKWKWEMLPWQLAEINSIEFFYIFFSSYLWVTKLFILLFLFFKLTAKIISIMLNKNTMSTYFFINLYLFSFIVYFTLFQF